MGGIPDSTLMSWRDGSGEKTDWWNEAFGYARDEASSSLIAKYRAIAEKALVTASERLTDSRTTARDAAMISAIMVDKMLLLSGRATSITRREESLSELARQFTKLSQQHKGQITDQSEGKQDES